MDAKTRRKIEMGSRALSFSRAHADPSAGYAINVARLEERLARAGQLIDLQREGFAQVRGTTVQKRDLRRIMRRTQLLHIGRVAEMAANEVPDLTQKFVVPKEQTPYLEFQASARALLAEAQSQKELLVKHGLAESLLDGLVKNMEQFDQAVDQAREARRSHVGASAELDAIGDEIVHLVKVMDPHNRFRFAGAVEVLAEWESASNVFGPVHPAADKPATPGEPPAAGQGSAAA